VSEGAQTSNDTKRIGICHFRCILRGESELYTPVSRVGILLPHDPHEFRLDSSTADAISKPNVRAFCIVIFLVNRQHSPDIRIAFSPDDRIITFRRVERCGATRL
jgi:hypothetical protein